MKFGTPDIDPAPSQGERLKAAVLSAIAEGVDAAWSDERFNEIALPLARWQYERNEPYQRFCRANGRDPHAASDWSEVPALPTAAFKAADVTCFPPEEARIVYRTSGTTAAESRGRHLLRDTDLYDASLLPNLKAHLFSDVDRMRIVALVPPPTEAPDSSLSHMIGAALDAWGDRDSAFYVRAGDVDSSGVIAALREVDSPGSPVAILGTAFAFVHLLDHLHAEGLRFGLPAGSRIMDTGGFKGRTREVAKEALWGLYEERLGIPATHVVNEYGMTEMASQFYDCVLRDHHSRRLRSRRKVPPPWVRTLVVDPETLEPLPHGKQGILQHFDLANVESVCAIQTADLGVWLGDGFEVIGRASGAEPRGCSLGVEATAG